MLEIYNEQVKDLLTPGGAKNNLQVRQKSSVGSFYVQDLTKVLVGNYKEIEKLIDEGTNNRTIASTNMNSSSSRAHTVVTITFDQVSNNNSEKETIKSSIINLVDLAGSERADATGATGDRLKEGANINKSLSALGNVIAVISFRKFFWFFHYYFIFWTKQKALADISAGSKKVILVPYRDSVLTKLLQNALGGNR